MNKILILLVTLLVTTTTSAGLWPVITSIRPQYLETIGNVVYYNYYITQKIMEVGPSVDVVMSGYYIQLTHRHNPHTEDTDGAATAEVPTSNTQTISQTAVDFYNQTGASIPYVYHTGDQSTADECVAYIVDPRSQSQGDSPWSSVIVPGGCLVVPPVNQWCKITTPELVLEHGVITLKQAEGSTATTQVGVMCTTPTAVQFNMVTGDEYVYLDEGKSKISVNNEPLKTKIDLPQGNSSLAINDLLTGVTTEGYHTGSSVLVMMPY